MTVARWFEQDLTKLNHKVRNCARSLLVALPASLLAMTAAATVTVNLSAPQYAACGDVEISGSATTSSGTITSVSWDWGDGTVVPATFPASREYATNGTYPVNVTAFASTGETGSASTSVTIANAGAASCDFSVRLQPQPLALRNGNTTETLQVEVRDPGGNKIAPPGALSFLSSNPALVQVDAAGKVTSKGFGVANVEVSVAGLPRKASTRVIAGTFRVEPPILLLDTTSQTTGQLTLVAANADGSPLSLGGHTLNFTGGNAVASVNSTGLVTALRRPLSLAETPYIFAVLDGVPSHNSAVVRVTPTSLGLTVVNTGQPDVAYTFPQQIGGFNYEQALSNYDVPRITELAYRLQREASGVRPYSGDVQYLVNDPYHGGDGTNSGTCGLPGNPLRIGTDVDSPSNTCLIQTFSPFRPQWGVLFHELAHSFLGSTRFTQFASASPVSGSNVTYLEGWPTALSMYAAQMLSQRAAELHVPPSVANDILSSAWHFGSTPALDSYVSGGAVYATINANVLDDIVSVLAGQYGYRLLQRFQSIFTPPDDPLPFAITSDAQQATFFVAAMSAAAGVDLRSQFAGSWGFPVDNAYYASIFPKVKRLVAQPAILPSAMSYAANGGTGNVNVYAATGYAWNATSSAPWLTVTSGAAGSGNGVVQFTVASNATASTRSATINIGNESFAVYQGIPFTDVPPGAQFETEIGKLAARGITLGCGGPSYCPDVAVTRDQMAAFIIRALGMPNPPTPAFQRFADVPPSNPFYAFIEQMALRGITAGCGGSNYCPSTAVTRDQMAAFMIRALGETNVLAPSTQRFNDVPPSNLFYRFVDRMAVTQVTLGCSASPPLYCPSDPVTRRQMAAFLVRAFNP